MASFPFPDRTITSFESVQRIDWSFSCSRWPNKSLVDDSVAFFWHLVHITPGLRYLSMVGSKGFIYRLDPAFLSDLDPYFACLRVLHVESMTLREWNLPSLTHLVTTDASLCRTLRPLVVELDPMTNHAVDLVLELCPQLQELSYDLTSSEPPARRIAENPHLASSIQCVRLCAKNFQPIPEMVTRLHRHFAGLSGPRFPSLRRCILHCDWPISQWLVKYTARWVEILRARGCTLEWAD
jgi:hypothetical protein